MSTRGYNKCVLVGNLTADPELRYTGVGTPFTIFRIAVTRAYSSNGQTQADTQYFGAIIWGNAAEAAHAHLTKGNQVLVDGRLENRQYTDPATQQAHRFTEIVCSARVFLDGRRGESGRGEPGSSLPGEDPPPDTTASY